MYIKYPRPGMINAVPRTMNKSRNHVDGRTMLTKIGAHKTIKLSNKLVARM